MIHRSYDKSLPSSKECFRTTVGVKQGWVLAPSSSKFMPDALKEHDGKVSTGGRNNTNLCFADNIDALAEEELEQKALVVSSDKLCTRYNIETSAKKAKLMSNGTNGVDSFLTRDFNC